MSRLAPHDKDIECNVLGSIIVDYNCINLIESDLSPDLFYLDQHRVICEAMLHLRNKSVPIDLITITRQIKSVGKIQFIGGSGYLTSLLSSATPYKIEYYIKVLQELWTKRKIIFDNSESIDLAYNEGTDIFDLIDKSEKNLTEITRKLIVGKILSSSDLAIHMDKRNMIIRNAGGVTGIKSGFVDIDKLVGGWQKSDLVILAARPSMGKTSLATQFLMNPAIRDNRPTAIFSLEMSNEQLYSRMKSQVSGFDLNRLTKYGLNVDDSLRCDNLCKHLYSAPIYFDDTGGMSIFDLKNKARKLKRDKAIELLLIDYLQLITIKDKNNREQEISTISRELKSLAKELDLAIIALSQMSREVEKRADKKPQLSDLRESGAIEQDADIVMFIYRPEYYGITEDSTGVSTIGKAVILVAKNRNGGTGDIVLNWQPQRTTFLDNNTYEQQPF